MASPSCGRRLSVCLSLVKLRGWSCACPCLVEAPPTHHGFGDVGGAIVAVHSFETARLWHSSGRPCVQHRTKSTSQDDNLRSVCCVPFHISLKCNTTSPRTMLDHGSVLTRPCVVTVHFTPCRHVPEATICPERHTSRNGSAWPLSRGVFKASGAELGGPRRLEMGMEMFKGSGGGKDIALTQAVRDIQWPRIRKEKHKYLLMWTGGFPLNSDPLTACTYCVLRDFKSLEFGHVPRDQLRSPISPLHPLH